MSLYMYMQREEKRNIEHYVRLQAWNVHPGAPDSVLSAHAVRFGQKLERLAAAIILLDQISPDAL